MKRFTQNGILGAVIIFFIEFRLFKDLCKVGAKEK